MSNETSTPVVAAGTGHRWRFAVVLTAALLLVVAQPLMSGLLADESSFDIFFSVLIVAMLLRLECPPGQVLRQLEGFRTAPSFRLLGYELYGTLWKRQFVSADNVRTDLTVAVDGVFLLEIWEKWDGTRIIDVGHDGAAIIVN